MTKNLWHSCGRYRLSDHFSGKPRQRRATFNRFVAVAKCCGAITVYAQKTRIVIQARVRFAGGVVRNSYFRASLWLKRQVSHPLLIHTERFGALGYGHAFRLVSPDDIDATLEAFIKEAYQIGIQKPRLKRGA